MAKDSAKEPQIAFRLRLRSFLYSVIILFLLAGLGIFYWINYQPEKYSDFNDPQTGISFSYPESWKNAAITNVPGLIVAFTMPKQDNYQLAVPNLNVTYVDLKEKVTFEQLKQKTMQQMASLFKGYIKVLEQGSIFFAGHRGEKLGFVGTGNDSPLQYLLVWTMIGNRVYVLTYSCQEEYYKNNIKQVNAVIRSFHVK